MSTTDSRPDYDVIIVGAGLTGLVAAQQILRKEKTLKVLVLEAEDRVGGQVYSTEFGELGAKWIQASHKHIVNLCMALNFELRPVEKPKLQHEMTWSLQNLVQRDFWVLWELKMFIKMLDVLAENCSVMSCRSTTMKSLIFEQLWFVTTRNLISTMITVCCGKATSDLTVCEFLKFCRRRGGFTQMINHLIGIGSQEFLVPATTWNDLLSCLADRLDDDSVKLNTEVVAIHERSSNYWVAVDKADRTYSATCVIMAVDWKYLNHLELRLLHRPQVVINRGTAARASLVSFIANYEKLEWKNSILNSVRENMVVYAITENALQGCLVLPSDSLTTLNPDAVVLTHVFNIFGYFHTLPESWAFKVWPISDITPSILSLNQLATSLVWASSDSATCGAGYLNGAVQSGLKSAALALLCVRPQTITWQDVREIESATKQQRSSFKWLRRQFIRLNLTNVLTCASAMCAVIVVVSINKLIYCTP